VIAGDLTLRARLGEFEEAGAWLKSLKPPTLVLPGNHDLPYWNILQRFADPFHRYMRASGAETLMPTFSLPHCFVLGFNTTTSWHPHLAWQEGVARRRDIAAARAALLKAPPGAFKIVAGHHPFVAVSTVARARPVRQAALALKTFAETGVGLLMSGHTHLSFAIEAEAAGRSMIAVGAPTALSSRLRGEANGFWALEIASGEVDCALWLRNDAGHFALASSKSFRERQGT
jgi:3',5'-cyclic AMP phosphodiesterase CpdA